MSRNLDRRVEVAVPIYDPEIKKELIDFFNLQWRDNSAARILDNELNNTIRNSGKEPKFKSQTAFYEYLGETNKQQP
jgi:polyphosphate kinase